jgi:protein-tyrosine phosphatase
MIRGNRFGDILKVFIIILLFFTLSATSRAEDSRWVDVNGVSNFRDAGGYEIDGGKVSWSLIYRSGDISKITPKGKEAISGLGIRTIVDLRSASTEGDVGYLFGDSDIRVVDLPMERDDLKDKAEFYRRIIVKSRKSLVELINILSDRENLPILIFDDGGVHEVEVATMFVLSALGVGRENLVSDYLLSNRAGASLKAEWGEHIVQYFEDYGGMDYYIVNVLGVSPEVLNSVRNNLIEE